MTEDHSSILRREFDASFQKEVRLERAEQVKLLAARLGDKTYGLRLAELEGVFKNKKITALPGSPSDLLGIAGFRGILVAVYDLAAWLGQVNKRPIWLALTCAPNQAKVALAFDSLEGQFAVDSKDLVASDSSLYTDALARTREGTLPVLSLPSLLCRLTDEKVV